MLSKQISAIQIQPAHRSPTLAGVLTLLALVLSLLFVTQGYVRRLNFDEWLVLRSGWLIATHEDSHLHFLMPWTWFAGQITLSSDNVTLPVTFLRALISTATLGALWLALKANLDNRQQALCAFLLTLSCGAFVAHATEIRYDAVILTTWLSAWGLIARPTPARLFALGMLIAVLATHHTKGLFLAGSLLTYALVQTRQSQHHAWRQILLGMLPPTVIWLGILIYQNALAEAVALYVQFAQLAHELTHVSTWEALGPRIILDWPWWFFVLLTCTTGLRHMLYEVRIRHTLFFALTPTAFVLLHPRPWDYMLAPLIPMMASLSTASMSALFSRNQHLAQRHRLASLIIVLLVAFGIQSHVHALRSTHHTDLQALQLLNRMQTPEDRVLDPSGAVYFIRPATPEWYLDGLFRDRLSAGTWRPDAATDASIVVDSYRLRWLPTTRQRLSQSYAPVCQWIWLRHDDPRIRPMRRACAAHQPTPLRNYWGTQD